MKTTTTNNLLVEGSGGAKRVHHELDPCPSTVQPAQRFEHFRPNGTKWQVVVLTNLKCLEGRHTVCPQIRRLSNSVIRRRLRPLIRPADSGFSALRTTNTKARPGKRFGNEAGLDAPVCLIAPRSEGCFQERMATEQPLRRFAPCKCNHHRHEHPEQPRSHGLSRHEEIGHGVRHDRRSETQKQRS